MDFGIRDFLDFVFCFWDCNDFGIVGFIRFGDLWIYGIWDLVDFGDFGILRCLGPHGAGPHGATGFRRSRGAVPTPQTGPQGATRGGATRSHRVSEVAGGGPHFTNSLRMVRTPLGKACLGNYTGVDPKQR